MVTLHAGLARTAVFYAIIMGIWGLWRFFRKQPMEGGYFGAVVIGELLFLAQALIGLILIIMGNYNELARPALHILYGIVSLLVVPGVFVYSRGDTSPRVALFYALAFFFLAAMMYFRSILTGYEGKAVEQTLLIILSGRLLI